MVLSDDRIYEIAEAYGTLDSEYRRAEFARTIEAEVRKQDEALIRQLVESMCWAARVMTISEYEAPGYFAAISAARARLEQP